METDNVTGERNLDGGFLDGDFGKWSWFVWVTMVEILNEVIGRELSGR